MVGCVEFDERRGAVESRSQCLGPARYLKGLVGATLGAAALALTGGAHAGGLFLPVGAADVVPGSSEMDPDARELRVHIARQELRAVRDEVENAGAGRLLLNVADGAQLDVAVERTEPTRSGYSLSGQVAGEAGGFVTLVVHEEAVAGSIWTPSAEYELSSLGGAVHALRDVTNAPPIECGGVLPTQLPAGAVAQGGTDDGSVVDILVVWTPEAEEEWDGARQMLSRVELLIAWTNDAFERSGAFVALNLVGTAKVEYTEAEYHTDLGRLVDPDDGYMDDVHDQADAVGADLIYLLVSNCCQGIAVLGGSFGVSGARRELFAHEVGHNMGLHHDRRADGFGGFQSGFTTEHCLATIMSYGASCERFNGPTLPFFGSPWRYDPVHGVPLGVMRSAEEQGARGPADAVLALNRNRHRAANYRPSGTGSER